MSFKRVHLPVLGATQRPATHGGAVPGVATPGLAPHRDARRGNEARGNATSGVALRGNAAQRNPKRGLSIREAKEIAGNLGSPSKMPGFSYGLSATLCNVGSKLRKVPGSVCSGCYALTDWYRSWRPLLEGHEKRERGLRHPLWVPAMIRLIENYCTGDHAYFRWHDSGDLRGLWHLQNIVAVCASTPNVKHWLPTREYDVVKAFLATNALPSNLVVRLSAHMIDSDPVLPPELAHLPVSTVSSVPLQRLGIQIVEGKGSIECRAVEARDNKCGPCRACWDARVRCVSYPQH